MQSALAPAQGTQHGSQGPGSSGYKVFSVTEAFADGCWRDSSCEAGVAKWKWFSPRCEN